jgi:hypothetical protein
LRSFRSGEWNSTRHDVEERPAMLADEYATVKDAVSRGAGFDQAVKTLTFPATSAQLREPNFGLSSGSSSCRQVGCSTQSIDKALP